jgi:hypothetical protein
MQDLSVVTADELVSYIRDQGGFGLRKGLRDMGVSVDGMQSFGEHAQCTVVFLF